MVRLKDDGSFALDLRYFRHASGEGANYAVKEGVPSGGRLWSDALIDLLGPARDPSAPLEDRHRDIARSAQVTYETAQTSLAAAKAQSAQASANVSQARLSLSYATIYSPVDGVVLSRAVELGQTVASSLQAPTLFTIAEDLKKMQNDTAVAEGYVGAPKDGMKATFPGDPVPGRLVPRTEAEADDTRTPVRTTARTRISG